MTGNRIVEEETQFTPHFDANGLIPVIAQDARTDRVLMFAWMNREALDLTIKTGLAHYYSRSRKKIWKKGEQSGHTQKVIQVLTDCDQDCILLKVSVDAGQCHTGYLSCFYRALRKASADTLEFIAEKVFDPKRIYKD